MQNVSWGQAPLPAAGAQVTRGSTSCSKRAHIDADAEEGALGPAGSDTRVLSLGGEHVQD